MDKHVFKKRFNSGLRAFCALAALLMLAVSLCACGKKPNGGEITPATELPADMDGTVIPTEEQRDRILALAAAFRQFGEYSEGSLTFAKLEHMVFCMFTDSDELADCDRAGFGRISSEAADKMLRGVFGDMEIMDVMRRKYDPDEDQTYYFSGGSYYVVRTDNSDYGYELKGVKAYKGEDGRTYHAAIVTVSRGGQTEMDLVFSLIPDAEHIYRVSACDISMWS